MSSSSQDSASSPFLSRPTARIRDDNISHTGSSPCSSAEIISPPGQQPQQPQHHQRQSQTNQRPAARASVIQSWKREFGGAILLLISVAAIPATLYPHDGQPLPQWPFSISINALLSTYSLMLRASLGFIVTSCIGQLQWSWYLKARPLKDVVRFHEAANGTLGSAQWLWDKRLRQPLTALGAMISIVALAIDPFIQQLIHAADCSTTLSNDMPATVPRTNFLSQDDSRLKTHPLPTILDGLNTFKNLTDFECSTGNCTFENTYTSLAFCSQCSDRSSQVVVDEQCIVRYFNVQCSADSLGEICSYEALATGRGPCNLDEKDKVTMLWNLTTRWPPFDVNFYYDPALLNLSGTNPTTEVFSIQAQEQYINVSASYQIPQGLQFGAILGYSDSAIFRTDPTNPWNDPLDGCDDSATNDTWRCRGYGAAECILRPCVRTYSCSIEAGRVNETIVEESSLDQVWGFGDPNIGAGNLRHDPQLSLLDLHCITDADRGHLIDNGYDLENAGRWLSYNTTFNASNPVNASSPFPESLLAKECLYIIDPSFIEFFWLETLWPFLIGNVTRNLPEIRSRTLGYVFEGREQLLQLYNSGNVSMESIRDTFANLAQALTLWVRSNGDPVHSRRAEGDVIHYAVCVRVTWAWISLPAALAGLALMMLALTVATTARRAVPMWKLFPLAVLLCGPAGQNWVDRDLVAANTSKTGKTSSGDDGSVDDMSRLASRISVQLHEQDGKYQLCQVGVRSKKV